MEAMQYGSPPPYYVAPQRTLVLEDVQIPDRVFWARFDHELLVGRGKRCDMIINDDPALARKHCIFSMMYGVYYVRGLHKRLPIVVNGQQQLAKVNAAIVSGSFLAMGQHIYRILIKTS